MADDRSDITGGPILPDEELPDNQRDLNTDFYKNVAKGLGLVGGMLAAGYTLGTSSDRMEIEDYMELIEEISPAYIDASAAASTASMHSSELASYTTEILGSL